MSPPTPKASGPMLNRLMKFDGAFENLSQRVIANKTVDN